MLPNGARIHVLSPDVAARIAAGEVIERPASVVKELMENALDAGSTSIRVELDGGGVERVRIVDNGCGICAGDLSLAFERHATSKLNTVEDLDSIATLGFRGEALPSIAAVSTVRISTRSFDEQVGTWMLLQAGETIESGASGLPRGTTVEVTHLFDNLPARRKFLKGRQAESSAAQQVVAHYALANPSVAFTLVADGQPVFTTSGSTTLRDVLACLYGLDTAEQLEEVAGERHGVSVHGLVSRVGHTRATRAQQSFFVNGRWVRNRVLNVALEEGYHSMLMGGRHPTGVVLLDVPPDEIDVNVHPTKAEIRFLSEREVFGAIRHTVHAAVTKSATVSAPSHSDDAVETDSEDAVQMTLTDLDAWPIDSTPAIQPPTRALPALRVLGQASALFIIAEGPEGVYMVDQHAAHERILYDDLTAQLAAQAVPVQALLEPLLVELSTAGVDTLVSCSDLLQELGFLIEPFGGTTCLVRAVPAMLGSASASETVQALLDDLASGKEQSERRDRTLATVACKAAVKAGQTLTLEEMRFLVQRLEQTAQPRTCPHGRPTMILLSTTSLERQFGRR